ncbi:MULTISPECIES: carbohydrate ABC transporter permease [unclassified Oceanispirochaeta]|uniref:carbohydrate ABC transporter permease n=1 Tax=unclassified Oceanispirochaeta TaxID=2635722 RepID=UPI001E56C212|nr:MULTISPECIES: carbohydrate ABC transporter permease [unclassified Oceanispirochaeta]
METRKPLMKERTTNHLIIYILLGLGAFTMIAPFLWMFLTSVKTLGESIQVPPRVMPEIFQWGNYKEVTHLLPFGLLFRNTAAMIIGRLIPVMIFSSMAAYGFSRLKFPGRDLMFSLVLIQMMVPPQIFLIPQYLIAINLGWLDSIPGLILPGFVSAFGTFLLRQFFLSIPNDLEEAAIIDGCNPFRIYWKIMLPLSGNALVSLSIFTALFAWKELMWPLIVNTKTEMFTLSAGLANLQGQFFTDYPVMMAGATIAIWPMILLFIVFQKQFVKGIASTGIKG